MLGILSVAMNIHGKPFKELKFISMSTMYIYLKLYYIDNKFIFIKLIIQRNNKTMSV